MGTATRGVRATVAHVSGENGEEPGREGGRNPAEFNAVCSF